MARPLASCLCLVDFERAVTPREKRRANVKPSSEGRAQAAARIYTKRP
jgi:hypothetical protein